MLLGIICVILCIILLIKVVSRKMGWSVLDKVLHMIHKPLGVIILVMAIIHAIITFKVWDTRSVLVYGSGIAATVMIFLMAVSFFLKQKNKKIWFKTHRVGAAVILALILFHISSYYIDFFAYKTNISQISLSGIDITTIKDGNYVGEYDAGYIFAKVKVKVEDGRIEDIQIMEHRNERGTPAEAITENIIDEQKTNVDAISGATNSSRVIEKAVENALIGK